MAALLNFRKGYEPLLCSESKVKLDPEHCDSCGLRLNSEEQALGKNLCDECILEERRVRLNDLGET